MLNRFGIGARLLLAFCGICLFAVMAGAAALYSFIEVGKVLNQIAQVNAPEAINSLELSRQAERLVSAAAVIEGVTTLTQHEQIRNKIAGESKRLDNLTSRLIKGREDDFQFLEIEATVKQLRGNLNELSDLVVHRLHLQQARKELFDAFNDAYVKIQQVLSDGVASLDYKIEQVRVMETASGQSAGETASQELKKSELISARSSLRSAQNSISEIRMVLLESQMTNSSDQLSTISIRGEIALGAFISHVETVDRDLAQALAAPLKTVRAAMGGKSSLFTGLAAEASATDQIKGVLYDNTWLVLDMSGAVDQLVGLGKKHIADAITQANSTQEQSVWVITIIFVVGLVCSILIVWLYVGRNIIARLTGLSTAMESVAGGDLRVELPEDDRNDEISRMTQALTFFRDTAVEIEEANLREIGQARQRLLDAIESISEGFCYFDSDDKLVVANNRYRDLMYPGKENAVVEGTTFERLVRNAAEAGLIKDAEGNIEKWVTERVKRHKNPGAPHVQQRAGGQWIMVSERRTGDGGTVAVYSDISELKNREEELAVKSNSMEQLSNQIAKYLSPQVYDSIFTGKQEVKVASHRKKLTVFFSDIAGFTEAADRMESEELTKLLNHYLTEMSQIALEHGATIDKYVGDAIVIFFGDPESRGVKEDAQACVKMAISMRERLRELQDIWRDSGIDKPLQCRIGINTGFCTVGNFGSEDRMDYTIIGNGVNLASRLESNATPGQILISYETYTLVRDEISCEGRGQIQVKGIAAPVETFQVIDTFENLDRERGLILEDQPHFKLRIDVDEMSAAERSRTAKSLNNILGKLGVKAKKSTATVGKRRKKTEPRTEARL
jgi:adenylate cyclase